MSEPMSPKTESNESQGRNLSPEAMSLLYEELFDGKGEDDGPCYLPCYHSEKTKDDCEACSNEGENVEGGDVASDGGASENHLSGNDEECGIHDNIIQAGMLDDSGALGVQNSPDARDSACISQQTESIDQVDVGMGDEIRQFIGIKTKRQTYQEDNPKHHETEQMDNERVKGTNAENSLPDAISGLEVDPETGQNGYASSHGFSTLEHTELYEDSGSDKPSVTQLRNAGHEDLIAGKQHQHEDDSSSAWRKHKKHFFILSHAGKPIYSRYGDEHKLAGFSATLQAIVSFVENSGDCIKYVRAGDHQVVFLVKGPIYLVSISATDEPLRSLRSQLELLHGQLLLILTKSLEKCFVKNANFDLRPLLGGTETVFSSLIHSFSWNPASFLCSYTCLPLSHTARQAAGASLQDVADADLLFAILLSDSKVISLVGAQKASLHPDDILLLSNFVSSSESFRTTESFSPVCLPKYNATAFLYAYVRYLDRDTCLILITKSSEAFFHLKESRARVESFLMETHVLRDIANSVTKGGLRVEDLPGDVLYGSLARAKRMGNSPDSQASKKERAGVGGAAGLWHFMYRSVYLDQYVASEFSPPLHTHQSQKRLFRAYQRLYASMHGALAGSHQMQYRRDENYVLLAWSTADFEFFAAFDPLAEKSSAITVCNRVCQWIRDVENEFFFVGASPFNW